MDFPLAQALKSRRPARAWLSPGFSFILLNLPTIIGPSVVVYFLVQLASRSQLHSAFPDSALDVFDSVKGLIYALAFPVYVFIRVTTRDIKDWYDAWKVGAVLPPRVKDWTPGSIQNMQAGVRNIRQGYPGDIFRDMGEKYGSIYNFRFMFTNRFFTTEPDHIKAMLATQFDVFEKGDEVKLGLRTMLGTGVFNSDGDMWRFHRTMTRPFFSRDRISDFDNFERHAVDAIGQLKDRLQDGHPVDIQDLASRFTLDSATEFLFAHDVRSLSAGLPYPYYSPLAEAGNNNASHPANKFAKAFDEAQRLTALRVRRGSLWPLFELWRDEVEVQMRVLKNFIEPIIKGTFEQKRVRELQQPEEMSRKTEKDVEEGESLVEHLVKVIDDETIVRDETLNILLAGRDTTANSITFCIYMLAENPHVFTKLREEILDKVGDRRPNYENMREMKYLRAVINETIRLYPAVPFNIRTCTSSVLLQNASGKPFFIPAGSRMLYSVFLMHRRHDLWGPDADIFDPDRFIDERLKRFITPNPFIFLPFNAGPRICLGQQFAYHETSYFLIRLLQNFSSISLDLKAQPAWAAPPPEWRHGFGTQRTDKIRPKSYLTMSVVGGVWVHMEEATDGERKT